MTLNKPVVGLIGGIGSGKSRVAAEFARHGGRVVSGDQAGHEALRQPAIRDQVVRRWGPQVLDEQGEVDRRKLGAIVFADAKERRALEAMVFPWIERRLQEQVAEAVADPAVTLVVLDAAIMLEAGWNKLCDRLVYVHAPREVRLQRLAQQRGWTEKEVAARENAQLSLTEKRSRADYVVDNSGSPEDLARQVDDLLRRWGTGA
ncbi:MAG TPA: dephospho-CoA kinase [Gemmataceae bacterium]|nr:dephospho-CoA kinase [Gemmataceae bacterium]